MGEKYGRVRLFRTTTRFERVRPGPETVYSVEEVAEHDPEEDVHAAPIVKPEGIVITTEVEAEDSVFLSVNGEVIVREILDALNSATFSSLLTPTDVSVSATKDTVALAKYSILYSPAVCVWKANATVAVTS